MLLGEPRNQSAANHAFHAEQEKYWNDSLGSIGAKLQNFTKYVRREDLTKFLARNDVSVRQIHVHGSVVDIGVGRGASLMTWLHLSSIYEPSNYTRKVIGFDTFTGIPRLSPLEESAPATSEQLYVGGFAVEEHMAADIGRATRMHDATRYLGHMLHCAFHHDMAFDPPGRRWGAIETTPDLDLLLVALRTGAAVLLDRLDQALATRATLSLGSHRHISPCQLSIPPRAVSKPVAPSGSRQVGAARCTAHSASCPLPCSTLHGDHAQ